MLEIGVRTLHVALTALLEKAPAIGDERKIQQIKLLSDKDNNSWLIPKFAPGSDKMTKLISQKIVEINVLSMYI